MTTATTFTFAVFVTAIAIAVAIAFTTTTAAATFAAHHLYETLELFIGSIAKGHHVAFEMKVFASTRPWKRLPSAFMRGSTAPG